MDTEERK